MRKTEREDKLCELVPLRTDERGLALILTVFVVSLASILVLGLAKETHFSEKASRGFIESIQADYMLKSALNFAQVLVVHIPKVDLEGRSYQTDHLGEQWAQVGNNPGLPISPSFEGEIRLAIVDEDRKINLNAIVGGDEQSKFWQGALRILFEDFGFQQNTFPEEQQRTLGDIEYDFGNQVAVIHDWIDEDPTAHILPVGAGRGKGIESSRNRNWFYDRNFKKLSEVLLVPGMTRERLARIAPFVSVRGGETSGRIRVSDMQININTASPIVLEAIVGDRIANDIITQRSITPNGISQANANTLLRDQGTVCGTNQCYKTSSSNFTIYARVKMANITRWLRATLVKTGDRGTVTSLEIY